MDSNKNMQFVQQFWDQYITPTLMEYIKIPNKSPMFDANWQKNGFMEEAIALITHWCNQHALPDMKIEVLRLPGRTPLILVDIPGTVDETILLYGHLDKQPEMVGWDQDLGPWTPVLKDEKLYGRGGADDGYAVFAALTAIKLLHAENIPHARCLILIEASEESGSPDLPFYIDTLQARLQNINLVICLDSGCGNYQNLWLSTSLRGLMSGTLTIKVLNQGIHSGIGSGVVPSVFLILRQLLDRIEDAKTGKILLDDLYVNIPETRLAQIEETAKILGEKIFSVLPLKKNILSLAKEPKEQILNQTWRPALSLIGADGLPPTQNAGNVTLPELKVKLSMRLPPTLEAKPVAKKVKEILENNPPFQASVVFDINEAANGWNAPLEHPWLQDALKEASENYFKDNVMYMGEGGSIPFMGMLGKKFPNAQFVVTGVLGPGSNAHGPNEFLHIPTAKKLTCSVAHIIFKHFSKKL